MKKKIEYIHKNVWKVKHTPEERAKYNYHKKKEQEKNQHIDKTK